MLATKQKSKFFANTFRTRFVYFSMQKSGLFRYTGRSDRMKRRGGEKIIATGIEGTKEFWRELESFEKGGSISVKTTRVDTIARSRLVR